MNTKIQTQAELIFRDLLTICYLVLIFFPAGDSFSSRLLWVILFVIFGVRQYMAHSIYYKLNKRIY